MIRVLLPYSFVMIPLCNPPLVTGRFLSLFPQILSSGDGWLDSNLIEQTEGIGRLFPL